MKRRLLGLAILAMLVMAGCGATDAATTSSPFGNPLTCQPLPNGNGPFVYVAIGASDAVGIGAQCASTQGYVPLLGQKMPVHTHVVNLGISGALASEALTDEVPDAVAAHPNIITAWLCANDFKAALNGDLTLAVYRTAFDRVLTTLHSQTHAKIFVANLPNMAQLPYFAHGNVPLDVVRQQTQAWNAAIATIVAKDGAILVDLSAFAITPQDIFADGFHPSTQGYALLAQIFWMTIQAHGGA
jgi:acyl-CoA thioesterase-1